MLRLNQSLVLFTFGLLFSLSFAVKAQTVTGLFHNPGDPVAGNPKGKVTVVEFFDYQCSHCVNMLSVMDAIIKTNPDVHIVFKEFPIRGPISEFAARAALAANKQGKYIQFNHALFMTNLMLTEETVLQIAKSTGLNMTKLKKDMSNSSIYNQLNHNLKLAHNLNVTGTPAFFIGKTNAKEAHNINSVLGEMSQSEMQDVINNAVK